MSGQHRIHRTAKDAACQTNQGNDGRLPECRREIREEGGFVGTSARAVQNANGGAGGAIAGLDKVNMDNSRPEAPEGPRPSPPNCQKMKETQRWGLHASEQDPTIFLRWPVRCACSLH